MFFIAIKVVRRLPFNDRDGRIVPVDCPHTLSKVAIIGIAVGSVVGQLSLILSGPIAVLI